MTNIFFAKPKLFFPTRSKDRIALRQLFRQKNIRRIDVYEEQLMELAAVRHPDLRRSPQALRKVQKQFIQEHGGGRDLDECGTWVHYPLQNTLVHCLPEMWHDELRTARNRYLITDEEQKKFRDCRVVVVGLSVGSHAAVSIVLQGGGKDMRLADPDTISGSNLNRIRASVSAIGMNKAAVAAEEIYGLNPYASLRCFPKGLQLKNIIDFLTKPERATVIIEETDDLMLKIQIREAAKKLGIPVLMATDNGDGVILDVERYDEDSDLPILGGRIKGVTSKTIEKLAPQDLAALVTDIIDPDAVSKRMRASVGEVGKTIYSWPQLGGAAQLAGVVLAYAARMIATGEPLKSGRTIIALESILSFNKR